jgi:hypothetical protein
MPRPQHSPSPKSQISQAHHICLHLKPKSKPRIELENRTRKIQNKNSKTHHHHIIRQNETRKLVPLLRVSMDAAEQRQRHRRHGQQQQTSDRNHTSRSQDEDDDFHPSSQRLPHPTRHPPPNRTTKKKRITHTTQLRSSFAFPPWSWKHIRTHKEQEQERKKKITKSQADFFPSSSGRLRRSCCPFSLSAASARALELEGRGAAQLPNSPGGWIGLGLPGRSRPPP